MTDVAHEWCLLVVILTLAALLTGAGVLFVWLLAHWPRAATGGGGSGFRAQPLAKAS